MCLNSSTFLRNFSLLQYLHKKLKKKPEAPKLSTKYILIENCLRK